MNLAYSPCLQNEFLYLNKMPNFKCKTVNNISLPVDINGVSFKWLCTNNHSSLLYTSFEGESYFLQILPKKDSFLINSHKDTRISKIGYIQKALLEFKNLFCEDILSEANALKKTRLLKKDLYIEDDIQNFISNISSFDKVFLEIGFGSGRHLLYQAKTNTNTLIVGIEIYTKAIEQVAKLAFSQNLQNVLLLKADARLLFSLLPSNSINKIFLHFPVPWDKQEHRRIISSSFSRDCFRILKKDGIFELRTDSEEYFSFSLNILSSFFKEIKYHKNEDIKIKSKYEDRWLKQEKDIYTVRAVCDEQSPAFKIEDFDINELSFCKDNLNHIAKNFKRIKFKGDDFFLHLQDIFEADDFLVLKLDFGSFDKPQHSFLLLGEKCEFLFRQPFFTKENLAALKELKNILYSL